MAALFGELLVVAIGLLVRQFVNSVLWKIVERGGA